MSGMHLVSNILDGGLENIQVLWKFKVQFQSIIGDTKAS